ncbi:MAG: hypothetical protein LWW87_08460 [Geobacteraceae bacterium]|nr:hypothetical protein [Geobacteraceae bacterium]
MDKKQRQGEKLARLLKALVDSGVMHGERNRTVANATGYSEGTVKRILSGNAVLTDRFIKIVCAGFQIRPEWVNIGEEPALLTASNKFKVFSDAIAARQRSQQNDAWVVQTSMDEIFTPPVSEKQLKSEILSHFEYYDEESTDGLNIGEIMSDILFHLPHLARHEVLELLHQIWKLRYNRSDSLAVQVADEDFSRCGIKPTTRLKLERIPVEYTEGEKDK